MQGDPAIVTPSGGCPYPGRPKNHEASTPPSPSHSHHHAVSSSVSVCCSLPTHMTRIAWIQG